jgi:hypothetical protein
MLDKCQVLFDHSPYQMTKRNKAVALRPKITLDEVRADAKARSAYDSLVQMNVNQDQLWILLQCAVDAQFGPSSIDLLYVDGMTRRRLDAFPNRLRSIAREIELVEQSMYLESKGETEPIARGLPGWLRSYADQQDRNIRHYRSMTSLNPRYFFMSAVFKRKLLRFVHQSTGQPHFALVADLLNGAFSAAGLPAKKLIEAGSLRNLYRRKETLRRPA